MQTDSDRAGRVWLGSKNLCSKSGSGRIGLEGIGFEDIGYGSRWVSTPVYGQVGQIGLDIHEYDGSLRALAKLITLLESFIL